MSEFLQGSVWRKWDLQVQPIKQQWLVNPQEHKKQIVTRIEEFINKTTEKNINVIAITDHNTGFAIDYAMEYAEERRKDGEDIWVLPGVELDANSAEHIIVIFNPKYKNKLRVNTWEETVNSFLQRICDISPPFFVNGTARKVQITTEKLIERINKEDIGIIIFAHCMSNKGGFFKEGGGDPQKRKEICKKFYSEFGSFIFEIKKSSQKEQVKEKLRNWGLTPDKFPIISSSDAHESNEIGNYYTWIKADPTYEGLKQILYEPEERVFLGEEPELMKRMKENPTKFISSIFVTQVKGYDNKQGIWFKDVEIPINPGLVAIIGNKGAGKSALLDIIGLCGNSHLYKEFSFLKEDRFKKDGLAKSFEATIEWLSEEKISKNLDEETDKTAPERVRYLPQNYFERLTNALETYEFEKTLEKVVFAHLPDEQKLGKSSFEELVNYKKEIIEKQIVGIIEEIVDLNEKIVELEKKELPNYKKEIEGQLDLKKKELEEHEKIKPKEVKKPEIKNEVSNKLEDLKHKHKELEKKIEEKMRENKQLFKEIEELNKIKQKLEILKAYVDRFISENKDKFVTFEISVNDIINFQINLEPIEKLIEQKETTRSENLRNIEKLSKKKERIQTQIDTIKRELTEEQQRYEKYLEDLKNWEEKEKKIIGDENIPNTIKWLEKELKYIDEKLRKDIGTLRRERINKVLEIYDKKQELVKIYETFKDFVDREISDYQNILGEYKINIDATLKLLEEFPDKFLSFINQDRKGSFRGINEGKKILKDLIKKFDFSLKEDTKEFLRKIIEYLEHDKREQGKNERRYILHQIPERNLKEFYKYLFSLDYLQPVYQLKLGDKNIAQLSPGEKGALLIVFYLMLDKDDIPLLIDQPEENLDNESIYKILTHFIRLTKKKRQIIMVTHNPNLAIVGDAEQIIFVNIDKKNKNKFSFEAGAIENPRINKRASDILEGTLKAFDIRRLKYLRKYQE